MKNKDTNPPEVDVNQLVQDNDSGGRQPGPFVRRLLLVVAVAWSLFQLWIASPLPFSLGIFVLNDTESRAVVARSSRLDSGVERQQFRTRIDLIDLVDRQGHRLVDLPHQLQDFRGAAGGCRTHLSAREDYFRVLGGPGCRSRTGCRSQIGRRILRGWVLGT